MILADVEIHFLLIHKIPILSLISNNEWLNTPREAKKVAEKNGVPKKYSRNISIVECIVQKKKRQKGIQKMSECVFV